MKKYIPLENHPADSRVKISSEDLCQTLTSRMGTGGGNIPMVMVINGQGGSDYQITEEYTSTITASTMSSGNNKIAVSYERPNMEYEQMSMFDLMGVEEPIEEKKEEPKSRYIVRRLTPRECERLQGFPDDWTNLGDWIDGKGKTRKASDTPRYKALGNSIALPQWFWIFQKMKPYLPEGATLGSLFDGIAGFPLTWEATHGKDTAMWSSEIEEFPIAVIRQHFGDAKAGVEGDLWTAYAEFMKGDADALP